jgi:hypothetical protein
MRKGKGSHVKIMSSCKGCGPIKRKSLVSCGECGDTICTDDPDCSYQCISCDFYFCWDCEPPMTMKKCFNCSQEDLKEFYGEEEDEE